MSGWFFGGGFEPDPPPDDDIPINADFRTWLNTQTEKFENWITEQRQEFANFVVRAAVDFQDKVDEVFGRWRVEDEEEDEGLDDPDVIRDASEIPPGYKERRIGFHTLEEAKEAVDAWGATGYNPKYWKEHKLWRVALPHRRGYKRRSRQKR